jgi:hypothetical protein
MSNYEIQLTWEKAERMAQRIFEAHITGLGAKQAKKDQESLRAWLKSVKENGIVYNGCYDEYITMKI